MILVSETMVRRIEPYPHCASTRGLNKAYGEGCGTVKLKGCFNTHSPTYLMVQQVWAQNGPFPFSVCLALYLSAMKKKGAGRLSYSIKQ